MKEIIEEYGATVIITVIGVALIVCAIDVLNFISASL